MTTDSPRISPTIRQPPKPRVLKTAYSFVRSLTDMATVFATTARIMMMTTKETSWMAVMIVSDMATKPRVNAFSVSVMVSAKEFLKRASMDPAVETACPGSLTPIM
ncbi:MAG: hypothetical protein A4E61_00171 [Syntrophorhabdus sp. PtaB.Bin184]|nr:MAG: hypothetical protein A4E61_00171 [Syntrophorhabdus sp. PtaB.Bin184]